MNKKSQTKIKIISIIILLCFISTFGIISFVYSEGLETPILSNNNFGVNTVVDNNGFSISKWGATMSFPMASLSQNGLSNQDQAIFNFSNYDAILYAIDEGFEFELYFKKKPFSRVINIPIQTTDMDYFYQPPLNEEPEMSGYTCNSTYCEDGSGNFIAYRPENVVGSYAVYHSSKKNNKYKIGKIMHIYRPFAVDSVGTTTWLEMDISNGFMKLTIPLGFYDKAVYPITVDPTFGYTTVGSSSYSLTYPNALIGAYNYTSTGGEKVNRLYAYAYTVGDPNTAWINCTMYNVSGVTPSKRQFEQKVVLNTNLNYAARWWGSSGDIGFTMTSGQTYSIACLGDPNSYSRVYYDTAGSTSRSRHNAQSLDATWSELSTSTAVYSFYSYTFCENGMCTFLGDDVGADVRIQEGSKLLDNSGYIINWEKAISIPSGEGISCSDITDVKLQLYISAKNGLPDNDFRAWALSADTITEAWTAVQMSNLVKYNQSDGTMTSTTSGTLTNFTVTDQYDYNCKNSNNDFTLRVEDVDSLLTTLDSRTDDSLYLGASLGLGAIYYTFEDHENSNQTIQPKLFITYSTGEYPKWTIDSNSTNSTTNGSNIEHRVQLTDSSALSGYIFSFDNGSSTFTNDTFASLTGASDWANVSKGVNNTVGATIQWKVYFNNSGGLWNLTDTFSYVTIDPKVNIVHNSTPSNDTYVATDNQFVNFTCNVSSDYNIDDAWIIIDKYSGGWNIKKNYNTTHLQPSKSGNFQISTNVNLTNGFYTWYCNATDAEGNTNETNKFRYKTGKGIVYIEHASHTEAYNAGSLTPTVFSASMDLRNFGRDGLSYNYVQKAMNETWRNIYNDSFGHPNTFVWKLRMDQWLCKSDVGCNGILDAFLEDSSYNNYQNYTSNYTYFGDSLGMHIHFVEWYNYAQWETDDNDGVGEITDTGTCGPQGCQVVNGNSPQWQQSWAVENYNMSNWSRSGKQNAEELLSRFVVDSRYYPDNTVTGWLGISTSVSNWYSDYVPFNFDNWGIQHPTSFTDSVEPVFNVIDWSDASYEMYYPNVTNYQISGDNKNIIMPCTAGAHEGNTNYSFNLADQGADMILCYYSHNYNSGLINDVVNLHNILETDLGNCPVGGCMDALYPGVNYSYQKTGLKSLQEVIGLTADEIAPIITTSKVNDVVTITSDEELWNPPILGLKSGAGVYSICNITETGTNEWECNVSGQDTVTMRAAGLDTSYNPGYSDLSISSININNPTFESPVDVIYPKNITINFSMVCLGACPISGVNFVNATINNSLALNTTSPTTSGGFWYVNVSVPELAHGVYNLTLWANHSSTGPMWDTEINATNYTKIYIKNITEGFPISPFFYRKGDNFRILDLVGVMEFISYRISGFSRTIFYSWNLIISSERIANFFLTLTQGLSFLGLIGKLFVGIRTTPQDINFEDYSLRGYLGQRLTSQDLILSDGTTAQSGVLRNINQIINLEDISDRIFLGYRGIFNKFLFDESANSNYSAKRLMSDIFNINYAIDRILLTSRNTQQDIFIKDTISRERGVFRELNSNFNFNSYLDRILLSKRVSTQGILISDDFTKLRGVSISIDQIINLEGFSSRLLLGYRNHPMEIIIDNSIDSHLLTKRILSEIFDINLVGDRILVGYRFVSEKILLKSGMESQFGVLRIISEIINFQEATNRIYLGYRVSDQEILVKSEIDSSIFAKRLIEEIFNLNAIGERIFLVDREVSDDFIIGTSIVRIYNPLRAIYQKIRINNFIDRIFYGEIELSQNIFINNEISRKLGANRLLNEIFLFFPNAIGNYIDVGTQNLRTVNEVISFNDVSDRLFLGTRTTNQDVLIDNNIGRTFMAKRYLQEVFNFDFILDRIFFSKRTVSDEILLSDETTSQFGVLRSISFIINIGDTIDRVYASFRNPSQIISFEFTSTGQRITTVIYRFISETISVGDLAERAGQFRRNASNDISIDSAINRLVNFKITIDLVINIIDDGLATWRDITEYLYPFGGTGTPGATPGGSGEGGSGQSECFKIEDDTCIREYFWKNNCPIGYFNTLKECETYLNKDYKIPKDIHKYISYFAKKISPNNIENGKTIVYILLFLLIFYKELFRLFLFTKNKIKLKKEF